MSKSVSLFSAGSRRGDEIRRGARKELPVKAALYDRYGED
jgi:hypothetical protein